MNRYQTYFRRILDINTVEELSFDPSHFAEVGLPVMSVGMPQLEALELVNKWNIGAKRFVYWILG